MHTLRCVQIARWIGSCVCAAHSAHHEISWLSANYSIEHSRSYRFAFLRVSQILPNFDTFAMYSNWNNYFGKPKIKQFVQMNYFLTFQFSLWQFFVSSLFPFNGDRHFYCYSALDIHGSLIHSFIHSHTHTYTDTRTFVIYVQRTERYCSSMAKCYRGAIETNETMCLLT